MASSRTFQGATLEQRPQAPSIAATDFTRDGFEDDIEASYEIIMSVNVTDNGSVGCAYYVASTEKLYFMEDVSLGGPDIVDTRKCQKKDEDVRVN